MKVFNLILLSLLIVLSSISCTDNEKPVDQPKEGKNTLGQMGAGGMAPHKPKPNPNRFQKELPAGKLTFKISSENLDNNILKVECTGFEEREVNNDYPIKGKVIDAFILDIDKNNYSELYTLVKDDNNGGNVTIMGVSSYRDRNVADIIVKDTDAKRQANSDTVYIENNLLIRKFIDKNGNPLKFGYKLSQSETAFILEAVKIEESVKN